MKPTMLLAFSFLHFALTTIAIFLGGAVVAQPQSATVFDPKVDGVVLPPHSATVLDIYGEPVRADALYYIYQPPSPVRFRVIGLSTTGRAYLYDDETNGIAVTISQGGNFELKVDTAIEIKFNVPNIELLIKKIPHNDTLSHYLKFHTLSHYWKVDLKHPDVEGHHFVTIGGRNEGYEFKLAQSETGKRHHLYSLTYTSVSLFCDNCKTKGIRLLDSELVADDKELPFQFVFVPVDFRHLKLMNLLRSMY